MAPFSDEPTTRTARPEQLARLSTPALAIAETIIRVSRANGSTTWRRDAEHRVWRAANHEGTDRRRLGFGIGDAVRLRALSDAAGGWVAWSTNPVFVPLASWLALHRAWCEQHPE